MVFCSIHVLVFKHISVPSLAVFMTFVIQRSPDPASECDLSLKWTQLMFQNAGGLFRCQSRDVLKSQPSLKHQNKDFGFDPDVKFQTESDTWLEVQSRAFINKLLNNGLSSKDVKTNSLKTHLRVHSVQIIFFFVKWVALGSYFND